MLLTELERFIEEDTGYNDVSSGIIPDCKAQAEVMANEDGVVAGLAEATQVFEYFDVLATTDLTEGSVIKKNDVLLTLDGGARSILRAERLALNFLGRMSGIATLTRKYVELAGGVRIACTRKTTPGFRKFEKKAVFTGGGDPHRFNLSDAVMIKDNHLAVLGLEKAVKTAKSMASFTQKIEVEVETVDDAVHAAVLGVDIIMFDNMTTDKIEQSIVSITEKGLRKGIILEASGGISLENLAEYASTGVDVISIGALTHSSRWLDMSMRVK
ncbi:MAG: carboxylating nicotinate-nucleotide diphosphorylase [Euryarchaeota archaeon]|nr:carboxylating nicotinate-nucleotide diphosphorylase [Euryarchaeota archaeon]MBU4139276.1 carboxylating nicotinate-nucleotide diphosphorylase [Euryarchaeota archaeon]